jgi:hypothetical protein
MGTTGWYGRWPAIAGVALVVGMGAACATEADPEALDEVVAEGGEVGAGSASFLAQAAERSSAEPYRMSVSMSMSMSGMDDEASESYGFDGVVLTGAQDGDAYELHMDMGGPMAEMGFGDSEAPPLDELSMDMVGDAETAYVRAPIFADLAQLGTEDDVVDDWMLEVGELGDRWGRIDLTALDGASAEEFQTTMAGPGMGDPQAMLDVLADAAETEDLGTDEIDGVEVHGTRFVVSADEVFGGEGASGYVPVEPGEDDSTETAETFAMSFLGDVPFEAWVDGDGYVRRLSYEIDMGEALAGIGEIADEGGPPEGFSMVMGSTIDFSDYGDPTIEITFPDEADTVDITPAFERMAEGD